MVKNEWSQEAKQATLEKFGTFLDTPVKSINKEPSCVAYDSRFYCPQTPEQANNDDVIYLFTFDTFSIFSGPTGLKFYKSFSSLEAMIEDGWVID